MAKLQTSRNRIRKPVPLLFREVELDLGGLFKAIPKAAMSYHSGKWDDAIAAAVDAVKSLFKLKKRTAEEQTYLLIRRSLTQAIANLITSATTESNVRWVEIAHSTLETLDDAVNHAELQITERFFKAPAELTLLREIITQLGSWFRGSGLSETQSRELAACLPEHFAVALSEEWRNNSKDFDRLAAYSPSFAKAEERERYWSRYRTWLRLQADPQLFDESFSLRSVYVELRSYWEKPRRHDESNDARVRQHRTRRVVGRLKDQVAAWLEAASPRDPVRVISGGPGSGKSVFAKRLAAEQADDGRRRVLYVPLHQFAIRSALRDGLQEFCRLHPLLPDETLEAKSAEKYLLLFDGLDELSKQGRLGQELAREFFDQIQVLTAQLNRSDAVEATVLVLLCGRPVAVSSTRAEELREGQVLHALPYKIIEDEEPLGPVDWIDDDQLLGIDQRDEWWVLYGQATAENLAGMPDELTTRNLVEITSEPLLNYLVSLSRKGGFRFSDETNRNSIYDDLLLRVYKRDYDPRQTTQIAFPDFQRLLEEVALAAWHGGETRSTTHSRVRRYCQHARLDPLLEKIFPDDPNAVVGTLFLQFYFRRSPDRVDNEAAFEFTHKSFGEYLLARRLIRELEELEEDHENKTGRWTVRRSLEEWTGVFGPEPLDWELWRFFSDGLLQRPLDQTVAWQNMLVTLTNYQLRDGLPLESVPRIHASGSAPLTFQEMNRQALNAEASLLIALGTCARVTRIVSEIQWPSTSSFDVWMNRLCLRLRDTRGSWSVEPRRFIYDRSTPLAQSLAFMNLSGQLLEGMDLSELDLSGCNLHLSNLFAAKLQGAILTGANLSHASLFAAELGGANLTGANLTGSNLAFANLSSANLENANLSSAMLFDSHRPPGITSTSVPAHTPGSAANMSKANLNGVVGLPKDFRKLISGIPANPPNLRARKVRKRAASSARVPPAKK